MGGGGISRRRGYLYASLVLALALAIMIVVRHHVPESDIGDSLAELEEVETWQILPEAQQQPKHPRGEYMRRTDTLHHEWHSIRRSAPTLEIIDLNEADSTALVKLRGIGPVLARRIMRYRAALGGFVSVEQLREVYGFDTSYFEGIASHVTINPDDVKKIDINYADVEQLRRHPYLDYYQAKAVVQLRQRSGYYQEVGDLIQVPIIDQQTLKKILPYITCSLPPNK